MIFKKYKHILLCCLFIAGISFAVFYRYMVMIPVENGENDPQQAAVVAPVEQIIRSDTIVYLKEHYALCEEYDLACSNEALITGAARAGMDNLTAEELQRKYPAEAGWEVIWQDSNNKVILQQSYGGLCPLHQKRWHLAPDVTGQKVVIYLGPAAVGDAAGVVQETGINIADLPMNLQKRIQERSMEFIEWDDLIGTLDGLDE
ncbi:MAG: hypothetical protein RBT41_01140 [Clostridia bacterium]|nr:hypothetical protein [Clostridia bacterium]